MKFKPADYCLSPGASIAVAPPAGGDWFGAVRDVPCIPGGLQHAFFIRNFNIGVLVLLMPPVAIFCSIFIILKRHSGTINAGSKMGMTCIVLTVFS